MNEKSKVLALKYRPKIFEEIIGQKITTDTIINSIKADKIPNAYLFTGIRGVGKTTIARIVAKSLNCLNGIEKLCDKNLCVNCKGISESSHMDVLELNGADKTSINDIRDLKEVIDIEKELKELVQYETRRQLNQYSILYYKKLKQNTSINEYQ